MSHSRVEQHQAKRYADCDHQQSAECTAATETFKETSNISSKANGTISFSQKGDKKALLQRPATLVRGMISQLPNRLVKA